MPYKKKRHPFLYISIISLAFVSFYSSQSQSNTSNRVYVISLEDDTINPVTAEYISKAIDRAAHDQAQLLVIQLDTPGGLLSSTRTIVKKMLTSPVPIAVYVSPSGSHAGSAGVFITYASHVAAMAPSTNIGAAHPVDFGGGSSPQKGSDWGELKKLLEEIRAKQIEEKKNQDQSASKQPSSPEEIKKEIVPSQEDPMSSKVLNDTVAFIKSIAIERGRNLEWAVQSVTQSDSITSDEAIEKKVVEFIVTDLNDLMTKIDGYKVNVNGHEIILNTKDVHIEIMPMDGRQKFFNILANPNIAYILMILGFYGLLFEITHPGFAVPGVVGGVCLILAFYSMQTLPTNYAGLALALLGLGLLIAEAYTPAFGILTLGGLICLVLGSMLLFDSTDPVMRVSKTVIGVFAISTAGISLFVLTYLLKNQHRKSKVGFDRLIGESGEVKRRIPQGAEGKIFVSGELWNATARENIEVGEKVVVDSVSGMILNVRKISNN
ncbi:MAG: nodulation protein NfeD [Candidatus Omnitrophica bacterium]|nr:nodulation protein NfeD [Candidatus Omnitrophota bacterium]